jgi:hypothetical protein
VAYQAERGGCRDKTYHQKRIVRFIRFGATSKFIGSFELTRGFNRNSFGSTINPKPAPDFLAGSCKDQRV